jgi:hypothetical protein
MPVLNNSPETLPETESTPSIRASAWLRLDGGDDLAGHRIGKRRAAVRPFGQLHADRNFVGLAELLDDRLAIAKRADALAQFGDRRGRRSA